MANEMRDRLVNLINQDNCPSPYMCSDKCKYAHLEHCVGDRLADHLIENGVVVLPCRIGEMVYEVVEKVGKKGHWDEHRWIVDEWDEWFVQERKFNIILWECCWGKTVFLTKAEAEQKLKEMRGV